MLLIVIVVLIYIIVSGKRSRQCSRSGTSGVTNSKTNLQAGSINDQHASCYGGTGGN